MFGDLNVMEDHQQVKEHYLNKSNEIVFVHSNEIVQPSFNK